MCETSPSATVTAHDKAGLIDVLPHPVLVVDSTQHILYCNTAMQKIYSCMARAECKKGAQGKEIQEVLPHGWFLRDLITDVIKNNQSAVHENVLVQVDSKLSVYTVSLSPFFYRKTHAVLLHLLKMVTPTHAIEDILIQVQKNMLVSGFAAGVAHEVNSPLSVVFQGTQNILRRLDPHHEKNKAVALEVACDLETAVAYLKKRGILKIITRVQEAAERATAIVASMLGFSRPRDTTRSTIKIEELIGKCLHLVMLDDQMKSAFSATKLHLEQDYAPKLPSVVCHPTEIEQVFLNLIKNALQAMAGGTQKRENTLRICAKENDGFLEISFADSGPGIAQETAQRIFDPFITTKNLQSGTGLGLFIAKRIVEGHHKGKITLHSVEGEGATFTIFLPFCSV